MKKRLDFNATKNHRNLAVVTIFLLTVGLLSACNTLFADPAQPTPVSFVSEHVSLTDALLADPAQPTSVNRILWVDSYHHDYEWSEGLEHGIQAVLQGTDTELRIIHMDTKRNPDDEFGAAAGLTVNNDISAFNPNVVIATDDNAQRFVVVPYLKDKTIPVVFAGVNWDASVYGYPASNVTGMVEVELPLQLVSHLKQYSKGERLGFIAIDAETERTIAQIYNERFFDDKMKTYFATSWADFKQGFLRLQNEVDIVIVSNNAGADDWNEVEAAEFFTANTKVPTGSINAWMAPYALLVWGKSAEEQGHWAAQTALDIIAGTPVSEIPITENKQGKLIINLDIAEAMDIFFSPSLLKNAEAYTQKRVTP